MGFCKWNVAAVVVEVVLIILFALFVEYDPAVVDGSNEDNDNSTLYAMFQDVHVMIFVGFGFLMTFLYKYSYSSVSFNLLLAAILIQWATLCQGFFKLKDGQVKIPINLGSMLGADIGAASFLITFGVLLGKLNPVQYIIIAVIEMVLFAANEHLVYHTFEVADVGGTIVVHTFGAYFGLACSFVLFRKNLTTSKAGPSSTSDMFSMIGTIFLWLFWPSFNAGLASGAAAHRALINTYYSLASCTVFTFATTSFIEKHGKLGMEYIQNATLAGGVAVGAAANMMLTPFGAMVAGGIAGVISTLGFGFITPWLYDKCRIHDTCGVNNLHGMPGILGALLSAVVASQVDPSVYGSHIGEIFPAMAEGGHGNGGDHGHGDLSHTLMLDDGPHNSTMGGDMNEHGLRNHSTQALFQLAGLGVTLAISIVGGLLTGLLIKLTNKVEKEAETEMLYDDALYWEVPQQPLSLNDTSSVCSSSKDQDTKC